MNPLRSLAPLVLVAALLAACGGGDPDVPGSGSPAGAPSTKGSFTALVTFGDSLSDSGTYAPATSATGNGQAPYIGGKFTTNSATGTVWVENLATTMGLVVTPAVVGFGTTSVACPAALANAALASTCTDYAQGGARVTDPNGSGHSGGALTEPLATQIQNHLTRFSSFKDTDLIMVWGGANDVLIQFQAFATTAAAIQTQAGSGAITVDQANALLFQAQTEAQAAIKQAAQDLSGYVRSDILAHGGKYVAVINLPDIGDTPLGQSVPESARSVLSDLSRLFNLWLADGLTGQPVKVIDVYAIYKQVLADPAALGFINTTTPACSASAISAITGGAVTDGSSLFCNATLGAPFYGLTSGASDTTWLFADSIHPTTGGHKALSDAFTAQLQAFGWL